MQTTPQTLISDFKEKNIMKTTGDLFEMNLMQCLLLKVIKKINTS